MVAVTLERGSWSIAIALVALMLAATFLAERADARASIDPPVAYVASVINLRQMAVKARADAHAACKAREIIIDFGIKLRSCESWLAQPCYRQSLTRPGVGYCYGSILLDDKHGYAIICKRVLRYRSAGGSIRPLRSLPWGCYRVPVAVPSRVWR